MLPCKGCITLVMCRNLFQNSDSIMNVIYKCSIIEKYTHNPKGLTARKFFKMKELINFLSWVE